MKAAEAFWSGQPFVVGEFDSQIMPGRKIVLIAKRNDNNKKTGMMIQLAILDIDIDQKKNDGTEPNGQGCSKSQCSAFDGCYVAAFHFHIIRMQQALELYKSGKLPKISWKQFKKLIKKSKTPIRIGEYGDPTALPFELVKELTDIAEHTGYTHQWRTCDQRFSQLLFASVENQADADLAESMGWKYFAVNLEPVKGKSISCPAESKKTQCSRCLICSGNKSKYHVVIKAHGQRKNNFAAVA